ncbi:MAG TPA: Gfo/Idh/MocA family oxidoreductase [Tepidisphaeraceae bacterium]|nr:Gfo/Idh/MocA family oxidoreductase [Tepidisphaeraceae bacterium]
MTPVRIGVIGCGAISGAYLGMAARFLAVQVVACADLDLDRARAKAAEYHIPKACSVDELLADPAIEIVLNLTIPKAHAPVALAALRAGKHTYCEKPLGITRDEGRQVIDLARSKNLLVGCAPDTFMGAGIQTAKHLIESGAIGRPVAFTAFMMGRGHESWHPSPEFYYQPGGGPMFDMGPYYLTALLQLLGPVRRLTGAATIAIPDRTITSKPKAGQKITVETPDHVCGTIEFASGCTGVIIQSFATFAPQYDAKHPITIYGTEGTLKVPDPNQFDGPVHVRRLDEKEFSEVPPTSPTGFGRSVGLAEMAIALRTNRPFRATGAQGLYVLDLMASFFDSATTGRAYEPVAPWSEPPAPLV